MDYISCWFYKAKEYLTHKSELIRVAFVSTNSLFQGAQVPLLWQYLLKEDVQIFFAYTSFKWTNSAKYNAGVTCVIVGLCKKYTKDRIIYTNNISRKAKNITPYLIDGCDVYVIPRRTPLSNFPDMSFGSMPNDGGFLLLQGDELDKIKDTLFIKKYVGASDYIKGIQRYCLWIEDNMVNQALCDDEINRRIALVKHHREKSKRQATNILSEFPWRFGEIRYKPTNSIIVPSVSSERRQYIPIGFLDKDCVISNSAQAIYDAPLWLFSVITSRIHMVWVRAVGGRLKTDYRYSAELCYNTFPFPDISDQKKRELEYHAKQVIAARENHSELTMAELYDPEKMPEDLRSAHESLDIAVEQCYRKRPFDSDEKRLEYLFKLYEKMSAGAKLEQTELEIL